MRRQVRLPRTSRCLSGMPISLKFGTRPCEMPCRLHEPKPIFMAHRITVAVPHGHRGKRGSRHAIIQPRSQTARFNQSLDQAYHLTYGLFRSGRVGRSLSLPSRTLADIWCYQGRGLADAPARAWTGESVWPCCRYRWL